MNQLQSYCGLICSTCPIYLATLETDEARKLEMRKSIALLCNEKYGMLLNSGDITDCAGCKSTNGKFFSGCINCEIRKCAIQKNLENCAFCTDYPCSVLENYFLSDPESKSRLDNIRLHN